LGAPPDLIVSVLGCDVIRIETSVPSDLWGGTVQNTTLFIDGALTALDSTTGSSGAIFTIDGLSGSESYVVDYRVCTEFGCSRSSPVTVTPLSDAGCANSTLVASGSLCSAVLADLGTTSTVAECARAVGLSNVCAAIFMWSYTTHQCECCDPLASPLFVPTSLNESVYTSLVATTLPEPSNAPIVSVLSPDTISVTMTVPTSGLHGGSVQNMTLSIVDSNGNVVATIALADVSSGTETSSVVTGLDPHATYYVSAELCTQFGCAVSPVVTYVNTPVFVIQAG